MDIVYSNSAISGDSIPAFDGTGGKLLKEAKLGAINFHPAPPSYPGVGGVNFALYKGDKEYGVTVHHMALKVDSGNIIAVKRFSCVSCDNVELLIARSYDHLLMLFYDIASLMFEGKDLPVSKEKWKRKPIVNRQLDALGRVKHDMDKKEIKRRIKATNFREWKPFVEIKGFRFELKTDLSD